MNTQLETEHASVLDHGHHADDAIVDAFAAAMKAKLAKQRAKGYSDWQDKEKCPDGRLQQMLVDHIPKGDAVDVANFAMFLWHRCESTAISVTNSDLSASGMEDSLYPVAVEIVQTHKKASVSLVQRHLRISYNRATALLNAMPPTIVKKQEVEGLYQYVGAGI